jgi:hypothetical protein
MQIMVVVKVIRVQSGRLPADAAGHRKAAMKFFHRRSGDYAKLYSTTNFSQIIPGPRPGSGARPS